MNMVDFPFEQCQCQILFFDEWYPTVKVYGAFPTSMEPICFDPGVVASFRIKQFSSHMAVYFWHCSNRKFGLEPKGGPQKMYEVAIILCQLDTGRRDRTPTRVCYKVMIDISLTVMSPKK